MRINSPQIFALTVLLVTGFFATQQLPTVRASSTTNEDKQQTSPQVQASFGKLPLAFEKNQGQVDPQVKYLARGNGYGVFLKQNAAELRLRGSAENSAYANVQMQFLKSNARTIIQGRKQLPGASNYFIGNDAGHWQTNVVNYEQVRYQNLYRGIDLVYYGNQRRIEYDFVIAPHANPNQINIFLQGSQTICVDSNGDLLMQTTNGELRQLKPHAYQDINGVRQSVSAEYVIDKQQQISFRLGAYDRKHPLVIDPVILNSTFLGGSGNDIGRAIAVGKDGGVYVFGETTSLDFPGSSPIQGSKDSTQDAFVLKMNAAGTQLVYATWLGGSGGELARGLFVDDAGNAYVTGNTDSTNFPVTSTALQKTKDDLSDAYLAKLNPTGTALVYSTFLGGNAVDLGVDVTVDANGNAYLVGTTSSANLPANGFQTTRKGNAIYRSTDNAASWTGTGAGIPNVTFNGIVFDPVTPTTAYASTLSGLYKSTDSGNQWQRLTGINTSTYSIAIHPTTSSTIYVGTFFAPFKSTDGGLTWQQKSNGITSNGNPTINTIVIHPQSPQTLYCGNTGGVFKSTDGGENWAAINNGIVAPIFGNQPPQVNRLIMDRTNPQTIYAATTRGFFKTTDGGANWTKAQNGLPVSGVDPTISNAFVDPSAPNTLYALLASPTVGLYRTSDGGANWGLVTTGIPIDVAGQTFNFNIGTIAIDPASSATLYATSTSNLGVFKSIDAGRNWTQQNNGLSNVNVNTIAFAPNGNILLGTTSGADCFVAKINPTATALSYLTYLNGNESDTGSAIGLDANGNAIILGTTSSANFPTANAMQNTLAGANDTFITKLNSTGTALVWSTFLGGRGSDIGSDLAIGKNGSIYLDGYTTSTNFPTSNAVQANIKGGTDAFVARLKGDGTALEFSTYWGGTATDQSFSLALDAADNVYVGGTTNFVDFPQIDPAQNFPTGFFSNGKVFVVKLSANGATVPYSTILGGNGTDIGYSIAVDSLNQVYVTGATSSFDFPVVKGFQPGLRTPNDAFIIKLGIETDLSVTQAQTRNPVMVNNNHTYTVTVTNNGPSPATGVKLTDILPVGVSFVSATPGQGTCTNASGTITCELGNVTLNQSVNIEVVVKPTSVGKITHTVSVTGTDPDSTQTNNKSSLETTVATLPSIGGRVVDGAGKAVAGITLTLSGGSTVSTITNSNGYYQFKDLTIAGNYTVTPSKNGYSFELPNQAFSNLSADQTANFVATICAYTLYPTSQDFTLAGGTNAISVLGTVRCAWTATVSPEAASWLKITSATTGIGNGALTYTVAPSTIPRSGYIRVADQTFVVFQPGATTCNAPGFKTRTIITGGNNIAGTQVMDINGDGKKDLVFVETGYDYDALQSYRAIKVWLGDGAGKFSPGTPLLVDQEFNTPLFLLGNQDFNNDQKKDVAAVEQNTGKVFVLLNDGAGKYTKQISDIGLIPSFGTTTEFHAGDMNMDGLNDLLVPAYNGVRVALNLGNGKFSVPIFITLNNTTLRGFGDTTGDGIPDLIAQGGDYTNGPQVVIYPGDGIGSFGAPINSVITTDNNLAGGFLNTQYPLIGDFNSDGYLDLAYMFNRSDNGNTVTTIAIVPGIGQGKFGAPLLNNFSNLNLYLPQLRLFNGDVNGDARSDLLGIGNGAAGQNLYFFMNDGTGKFATFATLATTLNTISVVSDLNADGKMDLIANTYNGITTSLNLCGVAAAPAIYGRVTFGNTNISLPNIQIKLSGAKTATTKTDAFGNYEFSGLTEGANYVVQAEASSYSFNPFNASIVSLTPDQRADFAGEKSFVAVTAATYIKGSVAPGSLIAIFGADFTDQTLVATSIPLPTQLGGINVTIAGQPANLLFVSPGQINLQIPENVPTGLLDVTIYSTRPYVQYIYGRIESYYISPGLFSANSDGTGAAAASVIYVKGTAQTFDVAATCLPGQRCTTKPIDLRAADDVYLELYGTGIRNFHAPVTAEIAGIGADVTYSGKHCCYVGVDQINVKIPKLLVARGEVDLKLNVDGSLTNTIKIFLK